MPIAVLDLEFDSLPPTISGLERYEGALILIRLHGRPVGQALLPVVGGQLGDGCLREEIMKAADSSFWEQWLHDYLDLSEYGESNFDSLVKPPQQATVAVCTRDRPDQLRRCLDALMRLPDGCTSSSENCHEFIVVDNCPSTDETRLLVEQYDRVRYIREDRPGLNVARNRALREAQHEIVAFTDDDATPDPDWLRALLRNFTDPLVLCVTGLTMPLELESEAQIWFQRLGALSRGFKRLVLDGNKYDPLQGWQAGAGVNMAIHKKACRPMGKQRGIGKQSGIGFFDEALDVGTPTRGGGDSEYFCRILAHGYRIVYDPAALNWHEHRSQWNVLRRQLANYETAGFALWTRSLLIDGEFGALKQMWQWLFREAKTLAYALLRRPGSSPPDIVLARFFGAARGPWAYFISRRRAAFDGRLNEAPAAGDNNASR